MNLLKGIEYCQATRNTSIYWDDWKEVPEGITSFPGGVKFRVKPKWKAIVSSEEKGEQVFHDETSMWVELKHYNDKVSQFTVTYVTDPGFDYKGMSLQFRNHLGRDIWTMWYTLKDFGELDQSKDIQFRTRPDFSYKLRTELGVSAAELSLDDVDDLLKHVGRMVRETGVDSLVVKRVPYV